MTFTADYKIDIKPSEDALFFLFDDERLLVKEIDGEYDLPGHSDLEDMELDFKGAQLFGILDDKPCFLIDITGQSGLTDHFSRIGLRELFAGFNEDLIRAAGIARQLLQWNRNHQYCGRCGNRFENKSDERAKICPGCGLINYTRLSPAIIVAVIKDQQILLANSQRFPGKFYSVLAGFVEPGETLEECVKREILEEVGIEVKNIRYFGSQPWPFPDSLMIAFTAEYAGGNIRIDPSEIADAGWFSVKDLPPIPPSISIARRLIDWFTESLLK